MKRLFFLSLLALSLVFTRCNNDNKNTDNRDPRDRRDDDRKDDRTSSDRSVVGKWQVTDFVLNEGDLTDEQMDEIRKSTLELMSNGKYNSDMSGNTETGRYDYDEEDASMVITPDNGSKVENFRVSWDGDRLKLKSNEGTVTMKRVSGSSRDDRDDRGNRDDRNSRDDDNGQSYGMARDREGAFPGKWTVTDFRMTGTDTDAGGSILNYRLEFTLSGKYYVDDANGKEVDRGTYTYDGEADRLSTTDNKGSRDEAKVRFVSLTKMILDYEGGKMTLVKD